MYPVNNFEMNCYRWWCSTKVDNNLEHVGAGGNWGYCSPGCPGGPPAPPKPVVSKPIISGPPEPNGVSYQF